MRVGYRFQPTPEELVNYFLKEKRRDPDFTDPAIKEVNIYKHHPCELPGLSSYQSYDQGQVVVCRIEKKPDKKHEASSALDEVQPSDIDSENNVAQDIPEIETQLDRESHRAILPNHIGDQAILPNHIGEFEAVLPNLIEHEDQCRYSQWDVQNEFHGKEAGQSYPSDLNSSNLVIGAYGNDAEAILPNHIGDQAILPNHIEEFEAVLPNLIEQEDQCWYSQWDVQNEFHGKEAGQSQPSDLNSSNLVTNLVTGAYGNDAEAEEIAAWNLSYYQTNLVFVELESQLLPNKSRRRCYKKSVFRGRTIRISGYTTKSHCAELSS
ncbi:hypothetical protein LWI29_012592 [Acer saccharum]|uniref:NAC domain-containing protein n=1 Tax=Acer saccharum TaxID=4024 RepID=A0AA39S6Z9_ACESA|nr:hypothetical protein LWI29_012592 [Acer saccharum]